MRADNFGETRIVQVENAVGGFTNISADFRRGVMQAFREGAVVIPLLFLFAVIQSYLLIPLEQQMQFGSDAMKFAATVWFVALVLSIKAATNLISLR